MAKLSIDVQVKGVRNAKGQLEDLVVVGEEAEKVFERISGASGFSALAGQIKAVNKLAFSITEKYQQLNDHLDELKTNRGHAALLRETKKQIEATKELDSEYKQYIQRLNRGARRSSDTLDSVQEEVRSLRTANKLLKAQEGIAKKVHDARVKGMKNYYRNLRKSEKQHAQDVARNEAKKKKQFRDTHAFQQRMARQRAQEEAANARKAYQRRKKYLQRLGAISAGLGFGFAAGGAAGVAVGAINLVTRAVEGLARAWTQVTRTAGESIFRINTDMEQLQILLRTAEGSVAGGEGAFDYILDFATKAPFSIDALTDSYVKLKTAGIDPTNGSLQTLVDSVAAFGGTSEQLKLVTIGFQQMKGKGVASMEELRRQIGEQIPTAIRALAKGLGKTMLETFDLVSSGSLAAEDAIAAMLPELEKLHGGAAQRSMDSMRGSVVKLRNAWIKFSTDFAKSEGIWGNLSRFVSEFADNLTEFTNSVAGKRIFDEMATELNNVIELLSDPTVIEEFFEAYRKGLSLAVDLSEKLYDVSIKMIEALNDPKGFAIEAQGEKFKNFFKNLPTEALDLVTFGQGSDLLKLIGLDPTKFNEQWKKMWEGAKDETQSAADALAETMYNLGAEVATSLDINDFRDPLKVLQEMDAVNFDKVEEELASLGEQMGTLKTSIKEVDDEFTKLTESNLKDEKKLEITLGIGPSKDEILQTIKDISVEVSKIDVTQEEGYKKGVELLKKQRDLINEMSMDVDKVTKAEVAAAKQKYDYYYQISRGGKAAGSASELRARLTEYKRLAELQKEGKADTKKETELQREKLGLLQQNSSELEGIYNKRVAPYKAELAELVEKEKMLDKLSRTQTGSIEEVRKLEQSAYEQWRLNQADKMNLLNQEFQLRKDIATISPSQPSGSGNLVQLPDGSWTNRYAGGPVNSDQPYIVGERGPELFIPSNNGNIIPNNQLGGSDSTEVYFNFNQKKVGPFSGTRQVAMEVLREIEAMQGALS